MAFVAQPAVAQPACVLSSGCVRLLMGDGGRKGLSGCLQIELPHHRASHRTHTSSYFQPPHVSSWKRICGECAKILRVRSLNACAIVYTCRPCYVLSPVFYISFAISLCDAAGWQRFIGTQRTTARRTMANIVWWHLHTLGVYTEGTARTNAVNTRARARVAETTRC